MCRVLAYVGPEVPLKSLLLAPENSLVNQALDPEIHPQLQLAGWGFAAWSEHFCEPEDPFVYHRPMAAFYDNNVHGVVPALRANTMLAHVRAADYDARVVLADENCHPSSSTAPRGPSRRTLTFRAGRSSSASCCRTARTSTSRR